MSLSNELLAERIKAGDAALLGQLWEQNIGLITKLSQSFYIRYSGHCAAAGVMIDDVQQCAFFALSDAVTAFDADRGYKLTAYLKHPLQKHFRALVGLQTSKRDPLNACVSLDEPFSDELDITRADTISDPAAVGAFDSLIDSIHNTELRQCLDECMATLPPEQSETLTARYYHEKTLDIIADEKGKSGEAIRQTERKALQNMKRGDNFARLKHFRDYIISRHVRFSGFSAFRDSGTSCVEWAVLRLAELEEKAISGNLPDFYRESGGKMP